jgi:HTH-like domain
MQVSRSCYYEWRASKNLVKGEQLKLQLTIQGIFDKSRKTYGSRRLVKAREMAGYKAGRYQVCSIMKKLNLEVYNAPLKSDQKKIFFSYKTIILIMIFASRNLKNETVCKKIYPINLKMLCFQ